MMREYRFIRFYCDVPDSDDDAEVDTRRRRQSKDVDVENSDDSEIEINFQKNPVSLSASFLMKSVAGNSSSIRHASSPSSSSTSSSGSEERRSPGTSPTQLYIHVQEQNFGRPSPI